MELAIAGMTAALLTLFDLDCTFYVPSRVQRKVVLYLWWWGFIVANALLAALLYRFISDVDVLRGIHPSLRAIVVGISYLAFIRIKFTTFNFQGKEIPFGIEVLYEAGKGYVFKRINNIAKAARFAETIELANSRPLEDLVTQAKLYIEQDQLLASDEKRSRKAWLLRLTTDTTASEADKRAAIADYILSGQRFNDVS